jgi:tetratricopeptide (TPR) repeat protein
MKAHWRSLVVAFFLVGFFLTCIVGTSTAMTFIWPAYLLMGISGLLMISFLFEKTTFALPRWTVVMVFALMSYVVLRSLDSPVAYFAREDVALAVACFLAYAGFLILCGNNQRRQAVRLTLAALVIANVVFALLQKAFGSGLWLIPGYERTSTTTVGGLFNQADHYAAFLGATVPLWLSFAIFGKNNRLMRSVWMAMACISGLGMMLAGSVVGWLSLATGISAFLFLTTFLLWNRFKPVVRSKATLLATCIALFAAGGMIAFSGPITKVLSRDLLTEDGSASLPLMWEAGVRQMLEAPMVGAGSRASYIYSRVFRPEELASGIGETEFVHNELLQVLGDYGIVGFFLVLVVLGMHLGLGYRFIKGYRDYRPAKGELLQKSEHLAFVLGAFSCLLAFLSAAMVDFTLHLPTFALVSAILLAVLAAPDPMSAVTRPGTWTSVFPGGNLVFATRTVSFACGIVMLIFGVIYSQSEYHYEKARIAFEENSQDFKLMRHLNAARSLDPVNPYAQSLSAHAQVAAIAPELSIPARRQALEQAETYFSRARKLYPQDVFAAIGHAAVLDELGRKGDAQTRLENARKWAPLYGNLMQAEAEHHLRHGRVAEAEKAFRESLSAGAFADREAAEEGLKTISEWKFIAMQNGIRWEPGEDSSDPVRERRIREAAIQERVLAGQAAPEPEEWIEEKPVREEDQD